MSPGAPLDPLHRLTAPTTQCCPLLLLASSSLYATYDPRRLGPYVEIHNITCTTGLTMVPADSVDRDAFGGGICQQKTALLMFLSV